MQPGRVLLIAAALCGPAAVPAAAATVEIGMNNLDFVPAQATAKVGDTIVFNNTDILQHTATARNGDWNVVLPPHKKGSIVVSKAGTFDYYCKYHPNMKGTLTVTP